MAHIHYDKFVPLNIAVLTLSDTRTLEDDKSGDTLVERLKGTGHNLADRAIVKDDIYQLRAQVSKWIADEQVQVIITTGGTGFTYRDSTPEAVTPLLDRVIEGFGETFRRVSYDEIGNSTMQSRAIGGIANGTLVFCLPGSRGACMTGWDKLIKDQLNSLHKPCNFVQILDEAKSRREAENV